MLRSRMEKALRIYYKTQAKPKSEEPRASYSAPVVENLAYLRDVNILVAVSHARPRISMAALRVSNPRPLNPSRPPLY